jgi:hypothetical protein
MPWKVEYLSERDMVAIIATDEVFDEDARAQIVEAIRLLKGNQATLVLVDCSEALSEVPLSSLYRLPDHGTKLGAPWNTRVAVVIPRTRYRIETYHFLEIVSRNAGYDMRLFDDRESAEDWLRQPPPIQRRACLRAPG